MKLRVYSDIHQDHYVSFGGLWYPPILPDDKDTILVLAGDLWFGTKFIMEDGFSWITEVASRFKTVLIVLGNHDYWRTTRRNRLTIWDGGQVANNALLDLGLTNVKVLDMDTFEVDGFVFAGCTLWTDLDHGSPFATTFFKDLMRHDSKIPYRITPEGGYFPFTTDKWMFTHAQHKQWLDLMAGDIHKDKKVIFVTHHLPSYNFVNKRYVGNSANAFYASEVSEMALYRDNVIMWIFGHSHAMIDEVVEGCRFIQNCVGYPGIDNIPTKHEVIEL